MGLTTWKYAPDGRILKSDVTIAKYYLTEKEIRSLERTVTSYFDYIEGQIDRRNVFNMEQFAASVQRSTTIIFFPTGVVSRLRKPKQKQKPNTIFSTRLNGLTRGEGLRR